ncbi:MAG: hypothetical protein V7K71_18585 [Nostoc sp.]|uniref:variant leucine-rich repeat-containing protein n=1 Tax=Nostoc sp. TaxID=1180 RepID=UPI002FF77D13
MSLDSLKQEATNHNTSPQRLRELAGINDELTRLVAANPLAESSLLGELAIQARTNNDVEMQRAIASNPNTPTQWLIGLAYLFPEEFFSNPAYDLSILQNVNFAHRFEKKLLFKLVCVSFWQDTINLGFGQKDMQSLKIQILTTTFANN